MIEWDIDKLLLCGVRARYHSEELEEARRIARTAVENGIAIEINSCVPTYESRRRSIAPFFRIAKEEGAKFSVGSDAHTVADFARLDAMEGYARELGLAREDFIDARQFVERRDRRRRRGK